MSIIPQIHLSFSLTDSDEQAFHKGKTTAIEILGREYLYEKNEGKKLLFYPTSIRSFFHNPFLPIVQVSFAPAGSGTKAVLDARLRSRPQTIISILILFGVIAEAGVLLYALLGRISLRCYMFAPLAVTVALYLLSTISLYILSKSFLRQLRNAIC